jgi:hypothetical protein
MVIAVLLFVVGPLPIVWEARWDPETVLRGTENLTHTGIRFP